MPKIRRHTATADGPDPIDIYVGERLRLRRTMIGKSQGQMARALGVSFQQVQKYERGINRLSASRLFDVSRVLNVPVSYFFEGLTRDAVAARDYGVSLSGLPDPVETRSGVSTEDLEVLAEWHRLSPPLYRTERG